MHITYEPFNDVQERVYVVYDNRRRLMIGYIGTGPDDLFNALIAFSELDKDEQAFLLGKIWETKGKRRASIPPVPPRATPSVHSLGDGTSRLILP